MSNRPYQRGARGEWGEVGRGVRGYTLSAATLNEKVLAAEYTGEVDGWSRFGESGIVI